MASHPIHSLLPLPLPDQPNYSAERIHIRIWQRSLHNETRTEKIGGFKFGCLVRDHQKYMYNKDTGGFCKLNFVTCEGRPQNS